MQGLYPLINIVSIGLMGFTIWQTLRHFREERPIKRLAQYLTMLTPVATLLVYLLLYGPPSLIMLLILGTTGIGIIFGHSWSKTTQLMRRGQQVVGKNSGWWLAFWAASTALTQLLSLLGKAQELDVSLIVQGLSAGITVGTASGLLQGIEAVLENPEASGDDPAHATICAACGAPLSSGAAFCGQCGTPRT
jgi:hypothetical protein